MRLGVDNGAVASLAYTGSGDINWYLYSINSFSEHCSYDLPTDEMKVYNLLTMHENDVSYFDFYADKDIYHVRLSIKGYQIVVTVNGYIKAELSVPKSGLCRTLLTYGIELTVLKYYFSNWYVLRYYMKEWGFKTDYLYYDVPSRGIHLIERRPCGFKRGVSVEFTTVGIVSGGVSYVREEYSLPQPSQKVLDTVYHRYKNYFVQCKLSGQPCVLLEFNLVRGYISCWIVSVSIDYADDYLEVWTNTKDSGTNTISNISKGKIYLTRLGYEYHEVRASISCVKPEILYFLQEVSDKELMCMLDCFDWGTALNVVRVKGRRL